MGIAELLLLAVGLSMDAFAVAVCAGLTGASLKKAWIVGVWFGVFQAVMPLIGYYAAVWFAERIVAYDHWVAFALLGFLGGKMIVGSVRRKEPSDEEATSLKPARMLPLALATSIDALAVGVSFAFLQVRIIPAVALIGATTLVLSMAGVTVGGVFGAKLKSKAELAGGIILVLMGVKILLEHTDILSKL